MPTAQALTLLALLGITYALQGVGGGAGAVPGSTPAMLLGFLLLAAYLAGRVSRDVALPQITGYLLLGILVGPHLLGILPSSTVVDFRLINGGALSLIALTAGGELRLQAVRDRLPSILLIIAAHLVVVFSVVLAVVYLSRGLVPFLAHQPPRVALAAGLLFGLVAVAKSPATTIAVITEEKARGPFTDTILGITVVKDVVVLVLVALLIPVAAVVAEPSVHFSYETLEMVGLQIVLSIGAGVVLGWLLALYLRRAGGYRILVVFVTAFIVVELSEQLHLEYILIAMSAGFWVQNFSRQGHRLLRALEANSLTVYALFFAVAGADLRIDVLARVWEIATVLILTRILALFASTWLGARLAGAGRPVRRYAWMGFLAQAGVTLGIANLVRDRFPLWGTEVAALVVAMIAVNQIIGPPAFRYALVKAGESGRAGVGSRRAMLLASVPSSGT
jgi:Kef-type K+ transport system membrane component KefB